MSAVTKRAGELRAAIHTARQGRYVPNRDTIEVPLRDMRKLYALSVEVEALLLRGQT